MKKLTIAAMVAILMTCAAQAVNIAWQTGEITENTNKELFAAGGAKSVSLVLQIQTRLEGEGNTPIVSFNGNAGNWGQGILSYGANGIGANFGFAWSPNHPTSATGKHTVALTFEKNAEGMLNVHFYVDGNAMGWQNKSVTLDFPSGLTANLMTNDMWTLENVVAYDGVLSADQLAWLAEHQTAVLPEPTALALLALGVAGVMLRRKAA